MNTPTTIIVHFRPTRHQETNFKDGENVIKLASEYKYRRIILDGYLKLQVMWVEIWARAITSKSKEPKYVGYHTYTKLYNSGFSGVLLYCLAMCQSKSDWCYIKSGNLVVHKNPPNVGYIGYMGWIKHFWNQLLDLEDSRVI